MTYVSLMMIITVVLYRFLEALSPLSILPIVR